MKIIFISDLHTLEPEHDIPEGDVLVFCGDVCGANVIHSFKWLNTLMAKQPHKYKIAIPGNHDYIAQSNPELVRETLTDVTFLLDEAIEIEGVKFYGTPWVSCWDWAFSLTNPDELNKKYDLIPDDTDVLITHGPPHGILDRVNRGNISVGSEGLFKKVMKVKPKVHAFGHIHESYGIRDYLDITFINASICNVHYQPVNPPIVVDLIDGEVKDSYPSDCCTYTYET